MTQSDPQTWTPLAKWLIRQRWILLSLTVIISAALWRPASQLKLDESIESFYSDNDPHLIAYLNSKRNFGGDEFVMVAYEAADPTSEAELRRIREFSAELSSVPGIRTESTQDLAGTLRNPRASGLMRIAMRLPTTEHSLLALSRRVLIGDDNHTVAIVMRLEDESKASISRAETYLRIRQLAQMHQPPAYVAGEPVQIHDMFRYVEQDGWVLGLATSALLMLVILIFFRSVRWVVLPILVIQISLLWDRGLLFLTHLKLSMVSSMLTSLITIIAIATVMHVTVNFRAFRLSLPRREAFAQTFNRLAAPIFWTSVTTAIGFGALLSSQITPVRSFAIMVALGTILVPIVCMLILPGGVLIGRVQADPYPPIGEQTMMRQLTRLADWSVDHPWLIFWMSMLLTGISGAGLLRLTVETDFSKNFRETSPIVQALEFFESRLGGVGSWEVSFSVPRQIDDVDFDKVRELSKELRELKLPDGTHLTKVIALTDGLDLVPKIPIGESDRRGGLLRVFPRFRTPTPQERQEMLNDLQPEMESSLYNPETGRMRIVLRALEQRPAEVKLKLIELVKETARKYYPDAETTGLYVLLAYLISSLLSDQLLSFAIATVGVAICMTIAFRSVRIGLISIIPNVLPIQLVIGGMGWAGVPVNIGTAMIASVSMGLTVDSTIHYLTAYRRARESGEDYRGAIRFAHSGVGLTLTLANVALVIGFSVLALSNFVPLVYFGVLVSAAMLGGLLCNLILLPVLLRVADLGGPSTVPASEAAS